MKRINMMIIGLCGLALLPQTVLSQTRKVSLQECINMALEKNPQMQVDTVDLHDKCNVAIELYKLHF